MILNRFYFLLIIVCASAHACNQGSPDSTTNNRPFSIETDTIQFSFEGSDLNLGNIRDISIDNDFNIYLLDRYDNLVKKFDPQGRFIRTYLSGKGRGPGETQLPNALHVDRLGNIYVTDQVMNKLIIVDNNNQVIAESVLTKMPADIVASDTDNIYVLGFRISYKGNLISKYYVDENHDIVNHSSFVNRHSTLNQVDLVDRTGFSDKISLDSFGNLYLNWTFPYKAQIYNSDQELISEVLRDIPFFRYPEMIDGLVRPFAVGRDILPLDNDNYIIRYTDLSDAENPINYLDLLNMDGEILGSYTLKELGISEQGYAYTSLSYESKRSVFVLHNQPHNYVVKHVFEFE